MQSEPDALLTRLRRDGFAFVPAALMREQLSVFGALTDWPAFAASWDDLAPDTYLAQTGRHRRRRYTRFASAQGQPIEPLPHGPHYQTLDYNPLQGNIERWFEPVHTAVIESSSLRTILAFSSHCFGQQSPRVRNWQIELHQFRIEARPGTPGEPTPEGIHRDGVDHVLVLLIQRRNIVSGTTTIHAPSGELLGSFTLTQPLDAALVDDHRVFHGVTEVNPQDPTEPAHRDVLVVTYRDAG